MQSSGYHRSRAYAGISPARDQFFAPGLLILNALLPMMALRASGLIDKLSSDSSKESAEPQDRGWQSFSGLTAQ